MSVVVVGANHRTAPLDLLERMAVTGEQLPKLLHALDDGEDTSEVVVLATCNRTEVYLVAERFHGAYREVRDFFADLTFLPPDHFAESLYVHYDEQAVRHLFEVTAGLDSAVPGEHEILGQVRSAWEQARSEGTARRGLNLLFRHALEVGKRARTETRIAQHVTSVSQAAVLIAAERTGDLAGRHAVLVGAGAMARGMADFLASADVASLTVVNRSAEPAATLVASVAERVPTARAADLSELPDVLHGADLLFTATGAPGHVVTDATVAPVLEGRDRPLVVVDIAVPRDVAPSVAALAGVDLLDMATVSARTEAGLAERRREVVGVRRIVEEELERFTAVTNAREVAPVVTALRDRVEQLRLAELERHAGRLADLRPDQLDAVESLTRGLVAKLLHDPTVRLKDAAGSSRGDRLVESLRDLFDIEPPADPS
ncbi:MAG: glutamyl-tRNA reductase [Microthrixaceae bacterium]